MVRPRVSLAACAFVGLTLAGSPAGAETLRSALAAAYENNPTLNAARANTRATDERVPQALSGWRPSLNALGSLTGSKLLTNPGGSTDTSNASVSLTVTQFLYRGHRTVNSTRSAEAAVLGAREALRSTQQDILLAAATAFMDVVRDSTILNLRRRQVGFLREEVRAAKDRFSVGEGTLTDVAQAESRLSQAISTLNGAQAQLAASRASFRQIIGRAPKNLRRRFNVEKFLPKSIETAVAISQTEHPAIVAALHSVDSAAFNVKVIEGELLPTVSLEGGLSRTHNFGNQATDWTNSASVVGRLTVPIYQGGAVSSRVREAKETLGRLRIEVDASRDSVRAAVISGWGSLAAARASIVSAQARVRASQLALNGVIEERRVGQRTTLDVLDAQSELTDARIILVTAQRDRVVAGFSLLASVGRLSAERLGLKVALYRPQHHYEKVRDKWFGLRTPDGR